MVNVGGLLLRDAHKLCFDGPNCMLAYLYRVNLSRFQPSQVDLFNLSKDCCKTFRNNASTFSYLSRVVVIYQYHISLAAEDGCETQRPENTIEATGEQLAV